MTFFSRLGRWLHESRPRSGRSDKRGRSDRPEAALPPPSLPCCSFKEKPTLSNILPWIPLISNFPPLPLISWHSHTWTLSLTTSSLCNQVHLILHYAVVSKRFFLKPVNILSTNKNFSFLTACAFPTLSLSLLGLSFTTSTYLLCFIGPQSVFAFELHEHVTLTWDEDSGYDLSEEKEYFHPSHHPRLSCGHDAVIFGGRTWLQEGAVFSHKDRAIFREYGNLKSV